jgi:hypothetical protein
MPWQLFSSWYQGPPCLDPLLPPFFCFWGFYCLSRSFGSWLVRRRDQLQAALAGLPRKCSHRFLQSAPPFIFFKEQNL